MPRPVISRLEKLTLNSRREPKNANVTSVSCPRANQTSRLVRTRHVEHIFKPDDQANYKLFSSRKQSVKWNNSMRTRLIVATINPILRRPCVHPTSFHKVHIH